MKLRKFQQGGPMPAEDPAMMEGASVEGAPVEGGAPAGAEQDPMQIIVEGAMQAVQSNDGEMALQVCGALVQLVQESMDAQGAPEGEPVFRNGGVLAYRCGGKSKKAKKAACGTKMAKCGSKAPKKKC